MTEGLPEPIALRLDAETRRSDHGRTLIGGSPLRVLRVTDAGAAIVDDLAAGAEVGASPTRQRLARRLLDTGLAHPVPPPVTDLTTVVVVPARDHAAAVALLLNSLCAEPEPPAVVVVDDGSRDRAALLAAVAGRADVVHHDRPRGPAAARNTGWRHAAGDVVAFVDADVRPPAGWLGELVAHFGDPAVGAVAPRIRGRAGASVLDRYEEHRSPLDLGSEPARVVPRGRVSYVPTATVLYRRDVLTAGGGFDETLRFGEDVDLVWRTVEAGHTVRYDPSVVVVHDNRPNWAALARQRIGYGSSAAELDHRHPGQVAPVELNVWTLAAWSMAALGGRRGVAAGAATAVGSAAALVPSLRGRVDDPVAETFRLAGRGNLWAGRWLAAATIRTWLPAALAASTVSRRARRATLAAAVVPSLLEWHERRPDLGPVRWVGARLVDDVSYCAGVWRGCWRRRSLRALAPGLTGIPGLTER